jgi:hypothetical protein
MKMAQYPYVVLVGLRRDPFALTNGRNTVFGRRVPFPPIIAADVWRFRELIPFVHVGYD